METGKERLIEQEKTQLSPEAVKITDLKEGENLVVRQDVKKWIEKIEEDMTTQVVNDISGQPILQPAAPQNPKIQLPITRKTFVNGFTKKMEAAGRWLSAFILRFIKIKKGEVKFKTDSG